MTLYLTDNTAPDEIDRAKAAGFVHGVKLYPGRRDHAFGCRRHRHPQDLRRARAHGEMRHAAAGARRSRAPGSRRIRPRDACSSTRCSRRCLERFPRLKVVFEHITTARAVEFVRGARAGVAATITPQHLLHNRNAIFAGGIRPHYYCLPILKRERDREALVQAATQRQSALFSRHRQRAARARDQGERLRLRRHVHGARGDRVVCGSVRSGRTPRSAGRLSPAISARISTDCRATEELITLIKEPWVPPSVLSISATATLVPYRGGETIAWRLAAAAQS